MSLGLYGLAWRLGSPLAAAYLLWRSRAQPEYRQHWAERWALGPVNPAPVDANPALIWIHAVSVGETRAAQPLIDALLGADPARHILLTHMTPTGRATGEELFARRWAGRLQQCYLPYDTPGATARFLARWRPSLGLLMETELWPGLCAQAAARGLPLVLVNARLSERSLARGLRWRRLLGPALASLAAVLAQTPADAARLARLGRHDAPVLGNLKFDVAPSAERAALGRQWRQTCGERPRVLCASTREGEEALLLAAWQRALAAWPAEPSSARPQLLLVPRHPQRFEAVAREIPQAGFRLARRSGGVWPDAHADVLLGDSMGEMAAYHAMADVAIIGGSLLPFGGQNLIEACALGVPVVVGPHTRNFEQAAEEAVMAGAASRVADAGQAVDRALALVGDAAARAAMGDAGERFWQTHRGATQRTLAALVIWLRPS
jgi:3-deoxy-D-manno-octulosonic-acid transferase